MCPSRLFETKAPPAPRPTRPRRSAEKRIGILYKKKLRLGTLPAKLSLSQGMRRRCALPRPQNSESAFYQIEPRLGILPARSRLWKGLLKPCKPAKPEKRKGTHQTRLRLEILPAKPCLMAILELNPRFVAQMRFPMRKRAAPSVEPMRSRPFSIDEISREWRPFPRS